ncbi:MAG: deoxyribonuclease I [Planctomycetota bacterium]
MAQDDDRGHPIQMGLIVLILVGGAWYFFRHYDIDGLENVSIAPKETGWDSFDDDEPFTFTSSTEAVADPVIYSPSDRAARDQGRTGASDAITLLGRVAPALGISAESSDELRPSERVVDRFRPDSRLRVASWALDGFGASKLASEIARRNLVRIVKQFDVVALQQLDGTRSDLVPRLVDAINEGAGSMGGPANSMVDYVVSSPMGPNDHREQLAILFNPSRVRVDRSQTYTVADPDNQLTYEPLVAWFRASQPAEEHAFTFTLVNARIELSRAPAEVALLGNLFAAVKNDGRGEDDVLMAGLFQADDAYLLPVVAGPEMTAAVNSTPTDVFGRHQTSNILFDRHAVAESLGVGGVMDFLRVYNLTISEAQAVSSYLPVFAEFSPLEGGLADDASPAILP